MQIQGQKNNYDFPSKPFNKNSSRLNYTVTNLFTKKTRPKKIVAKIYNLSKNIEILGTWLVRDRTEHSDWNSATYI